MRILGLVGLALLAVVALFLFARRRRMAREDRLTRE
jgi:LPXTG-motif cell wall-anchored protein